jgi:hypothetical protein
MKRTLYIPDELWTQLDQYLKDHPEQNLSSVVQAALAEKLHPKVLQSYYRWQESWKMLLQTLQLMKII